MQSWNLLEIETPDGSRSPVVLHSTDGEARAVLIELKPGQQLGNHPVTEAAWLVVVEGAAVVEGDGERVDVGPVMLFRFDPAERHAISSESGARLLLLLAPWPGEGHYRGGPSR